MLRLVAILLVFSASTLTQFFSLATIGDGSATSLRQKNTPQRTYGKLFRIDSVV
jgi:hypothetical protein